MDNVIFLVFRAFFITMMTVGMMASLTEFRYGRKKLMLILATYGAWVVGSSLVLLWIGWELLLLRLFFITILFLPQCLHTWLQTIPLLRQCSTILTQILLSVLAVSALRLLTDRFGLSGFVNILLMSAFYLIDGNFIWSGDFCGVHIAC